MTADRVRLPYDVLASISSRIANEVKGVNWVVYEVGSKLPRPSSGNEAALDRYRENVNVLPAARKEVTLNSAGSKERTRKLARMPGYVRGNHFPSLFAVLQMT